MHGKGKCIIHGPFAAHHSAQEGKLRENKRDNHLHNLKVVVMLNKGETELPQFPLKCDLSLKESHAETLEKLLTEAMRFHRQE